MKSTRKFLIIFACLTMAASAYAQTPREQLKQMVEQLQKEPWDGALREKVIKLAIELKPPPAIPEEARRSFIVGEALFKQAKNLRPAYEATHAFWTAATLAPWWSNAYWNLAVAQQFAGQYGGAKESLRLYLLTNPAPAEQRIAQDRLYAIDAEIMAAANTPAGITGFWQETSHQLNGVWVNADPESVRNPAYEIQQAGSAYRIKCLYCDTASLYKWSVYVERASVDAITFHMRLTSPTSDSGIDKNECLLKTNQLHCTRTESKGEKYHFRLSKRNVCEVVASAGDVAFVLCK